MRVPNLRFLEFSEKWEENKLGDLTLSITSGKTRNISRNKSGKYKIYGSVDVIGYTDNPDYGGKFVLIARVGANAGKTNIINEKCGVSDNTLIVKYRDGLNVEFSYYQFERYNLNRLVYGSGQPLITGKQIKNIRLKVPMLNEQEKIASFLSKVDEKIEKLEKKQELWETYKKGIMQQIFSQKLRFKDENGENYPDWEKKQLREISSIITKGTTPSSIGFGFTDEGINFIKTENITQNGLINVNHTPKISIECDEKLSRSRLEENDILFSIAGTLGKTLIINDQYLPANTNQALAIVRLIDKSQVKFINYLLNLEKINKYIYISVTVGAQPNLSLQQVNDIKLDVPSVIEQQKIVSFLLSIDKKIEFVCKELEINKKFKKGLLQQMFC